MYFNGKTEDGIRLTTRSGCRWVIFGTGVRDGEPVSFIERRTNNFGTAEAIHIKMRNARGRSIVVDTVEKKIFDTAAV